MTAIQLNVGLEIPRLVHRPTAVQIFRFSAVTWNAHKIHYDEGFAKSEGHEGVLVQAHFHGALLTRMVMDWIGADGRLQSIEWRNLGRAYANDELTCTGKILDLRKVGGGTEIDLALASRTQNDALCAEGRACVFLFETGGNAEHGALKDHARAGQKNTLKSGRGAEEGFPIDVSPPLTGD